MVLQYLPRIITRNALNENECSCLNTNLYLKPIHSLNKNVNLNLHAKPKSLKDMLKYKSVFKQFKIYINICTYMCMHVHNHIGVALLYFKFLMLIVSTKIQVGSPGLKTFHASLSSPQQLIVCGHTSENKYKCLTSSG